MPMIIVTVFQLTRTLLCSLVLPTLIGPHIYWLLQRVADVLHAGADGNTDVAAHSVQ